TSRHAHPAAVQLRHAGDDHVPARVERADRRVRVCRAHPHRGRRAARDRPRSSAWRTRQQVTRLALRAIGKTYAGASRPALNNVDLDVEQGELIGVVGESGSGKSTLLRTIAGLETPSHGEILLDGQL